MKKTLIGAAAAAATFAFATAALAVGPPYCGTYATPTITAPDAGIAAECQAAITKGSQKYIKSLIKTRSKCLMLGVKDACPNADDDAKVQKAAGKSLEKIAAACGATAGLGSSYDGEAGEDAASCTLSQNHGTVEIYLGETHGTPGVPDADAVRNACQVGISAAAQKFLPSILKSVDKCIAGKIKDGDTATLGASCVGSLSPGGLTDPADTKTAEAIEKATLKMHDTIVGACTGLSAEQIADLFGCPGATTAADLDTCVSCSGLNAVFEIVTQQYAETGSIVSEAAGAIQAAVNTGSPGDKFLITSGDYDEGVELPVATCTIRGGSCLEDEECGLCAVTGSNCADDGDCEPASCAVSAEDCLSNDDCSANVCGPAADEANEACTSNSDCTGDTCVPAVGNDCTGPNVGNTCEPVVGDTCTSSGDGMQFVGCGAATNDRPVVFPPTMSPPTRGFLASGVDGLHFQALEVIGWENDGIFVTNAEGVSFRDCVGDGSVSTTNADSVSTYAFFPVESSDVVVEGCEVFNVRDAGIYVGSAEEITVRHNLVHDNVTGIEIENSENADVYGNTAHDNTGGILSFKLPGPDKQVSGGHHFFDNVSYSNNTANFAIPGSTVSAVPQGTGFMILSEDNSLFENNLVMTNRSYGMLILDQEAVNTLAGPIFVPTSADQDTENLQFLRNRWTNLPATRNGSSPPVGTLFAGNWLLALTTDGAGTCFDPVPQESGPGHDFAASPLTAEYVACP